MRFYEDNASSLSINAITEFEQKIGCTLPQDYCDFLVQHNGGQPELQFLEVSDCKSDVMIHCFLGIGNPNADILIWLKELDDDLKDTFLPIGIDPGGNFLLMDKSDGKIYYWDSARYFSCSSDEENAFWVANSFSHLLERLKGETTDASAISDPP
jgi:SMI1 / KNR4 family (SUKH-1)